MRSGGRATATETAPRRPKRDRFAPRKSALWLAKQTALAASRWVKSLSIYRATGLLPFRTVSHERFEPIRLLEEREVFREPEPHSVVDSASWQHSRTTPSVLNHWLEIPGGLVSQEGHVFDPAGHLVPGATHKYQDEPRLGMFASPYRVLPPIARFEGTVAALTQSNQHFHYHWLLEVLPRLGMLIEQRVPVDKIYIDTSRRFQRESLRLLGHGIPERVVACEGTPLLRAEKLVVPCYDNPRGRRYSPWMIEFLRRVFLPRVEDMTSGPKRIYVSRRAARHRRVINEPELEELLARRGFVSLRLEELPFAEQVRLFRDAEAVVAPHGSGLTNLVFASPGTQVIELFPGGTKDPYYRLSHALGLHYSFVPDRDGDPAGWPKDDYTIRPDDLERALASAGIR